MSKSFKTSAAFSASIESAFTPTLMFSDLNTGTSLDSFSICSSCFLSYPVVASTQWQLKRFASAITSGSVSGREKSITASTGTFTSFAEPKTGNLPSATLSSPPETDTPNSAERSQITFPIFPLMPTMNTFILISPCCNAFFKRALCNLNSCRNSSLIKKVI